MVSLNLPLWLYSVSLGAVVVFASGAAAAQGPAGATGAVASIPGSVVRARDEPHPVTQPGLISIITGPTPRGADAVSRQKTIRRGESPPLSK
jgi:hypothetical protein